jgi:AraC-like DNA-binding protein
MTLNGIVRAILDKPDTNQNLLAGGQALPKGIVDPAGAARRIRLGTYPPSPTLGTFVDYFWVVEWDMRGRAPESQRVMPYPNTHLVFEAGRTAVHGVVRGAFDRVVTGAGRVLGVRFKPGGLRPFVGQPLSAFTDATIPADGILGIDASEAEARVLSEPDDAAMIAVAESMLARALPEPDSQALIAAQVVAAAATEHGPVNVGELSSKVGIGERSLQRLFSNYVGVAPKWVLQRFRLQEAISALSRQAPADLAGMAHALGFFDQAHFTREFSKLVGQSPMDYWKSQQRLRQP